FPSSPSKVRFLRLRKLSSTELGSSARTVRSFSKLSDEIFGAVISRPSDLGLLQLLQWLAWRCCTLNVRQPPSLRHLQSAGLFRVASRTTDRGTARHRRHRQRRGR